MLPTDPDPYWQPGYSEALGVVRQADGRRIIVGTGWTTPTGSPRAFVYRDDWMLNLNDPHLTWLPAGWTLLRAEAVNRHGWITVNGSIYGAPRAALLVPQTVAAQ